MLRTAIIGMGGFARDHHRAMQALEQEGVCRLVCTADPAHAGFGDFATARDLAGRGVLVYDDYRAMLEAHGGELDLVTVPTPVPLHAEMHRACVERRVACYLEKPPTLWPPELDEMLAVEQRAWKSTQVGFSFIVEPLRRAIKARLVAGEFGAVKRVSFVGMSPRATGYYQRARWAGRMELDGRPVMDSCLGNAMAHFVHNALFWAGDKAVLDWAMPLQMRSRTYRAHDIESADTIFAQADCQDGVVVQAAGTHACDGEHEQRERVECERATIHYVPHDGWRITWADGRVEEQPAGGDDLTKANLAHYMTYVRGNDTRPLTRLEDSRPFVRFHAMAFEAAPGGIVTIPPERVQVSSAGDQGEYRAIEGIREAIEAFDRTGELPNL